MTARTKTGAELIHNGLETFPPYRGGNFKRLTKILLGFLCSAITSNELKAQLPTGNTTISGNEDSVYVTGGQYNNGSLTITIYGSLANVGSTGAFTASFNGDGFNNYTLNNYSLITSNGNLTISSNTVSIQATQGNAGQFNFNNYGAVTSNSTAAGAAVYMGGGVTIPTFFNGEGAIRAI
jgi:hypothetical protein